MTLQQHKLIPKTVVSSVFLPVSILHVIFQYSEQQIKLMNEMQ